MTGTEAEDVVLAYAPKVRKCAVRLGFTPGMAAYDDVVSDGLLGLWLAVSTFDPARGTLSARIAFRVHAAMVDGLRSRGTYTARSVPLDLDVVDRAMAEDLEDGVVTHVVAARAAAVVVARAAARDARLPRVLELLGRDWSSAQIGRELGISRQRVEQLVGLARQAAAA